MSAKEMQLGDAARLVLDRRSYVDTIKVYFDRRLENSEMAGLASRAGDLLDIGPMQHQEGRWRHGIHLHQPTDECLSIVGDLTNRSLLSRAHITLDLVTGSYTDAEQLAAFIARRLVQPWHGPSKVRAFKKTLYYREAGSRRNLAMYYDRRPKTGPGDHCVHIEWRLETADGVKGACFRGPETLAGFGYAPFLRRNLILREYPTELKDLARIGRALAGLGGSGRRNVMRLPGGRYVDRFPMAATAWLRSSQEPHRWYGPAVQDVLDTYGPKWARYFPKLPIDWMLPTVDAPHRHPPNG